MLGTTNGMYEIDKNRFLNLNDDEHTKNKNGRESKFANTTDRKDSFIVLKKMR